MSGFTHFDANGNAIMVDVSGKSATARKAIASGRIQVSQSVFDGIKNRSLGKGDVLNVARIAGIMAAKKTADMIPLCHNIGLTKVTIEFQLLEPDLVIAVLATVQTEGKTGVEMEALTAASISLLTIYDMCKAVDKGMTIQAIRLEEKIGGKSGHFTRSTEPKN